MKLIALPRQAGKTRQLIELAHDRDVHIVVKSDVEAKAVALEAKKLGKKIHYPWRYYDIANKRFHGAKIEGILIDNLDEYLFASLGWQCNILAATITPERGFVEPYILYKEKDGDFVSPQFLQDICVDYGTKQIRGDLKNKDGTTQIEWFTFDDIGKCLFFPDISVSA